MSRFAAQLQAESSWRPTASSGVADGLAQFIPGTAAWISRAYPELGPPAPFSPRWALRALVIYDRHLFQAITDTATDCDRWAMVLVAYNGGPGWLVRDRRLAASRGADPARWWGSTELHSWRAKWAFTANRAYPKRILLQLEPAYREAGWGGQAVCDGSLFPQVLILGDSHAAGEIGQTLQRVLLAAGLRTARQASVGSGIGRWVEEVLVASPDTFPVVLLGTNDFARPPDEIIASAVELMQRFARPGVWLGPPPMPRADVAAQLPKLNQALQEAAGQTGWTFVPLAGPERPGADGLHFSGTAARAIGERAARAVLPAVGGER
ncbi:MAG: transglycosylase SLT domain-containing protein [Myxococcota bacterium]|nr:transglycosylase SLT domain-containing protein [Myxococcota bacterium]